MEEEELQEVVCVNDWNENVQDLPPIPPSIAEVSCCWVLSFKQDYKLMNCSCLSSDTHTHICDMCTRMHAFTHARAHTHTHTHTHTQTHTHTHKHTHTNIKHTHRPSSDASLPWM